MGMSHFANLKEPIFFGILSFLLGITFLYFFIMFARRTGKFLDDPVNNNKNHSIHTEAIPTSGGIIIFLAFWISYFIYYFSTPLRTSGFLVSSIFIAGLSLLLVGIYDDLHNIRARYKLLIQFMMGLIIYFYFMPGGLDLGFVIIRSHILSALFLMLFAATIINALNFIDGIDGLAPGVALILIVFLLYINKIGSGALIGAAAMIGALAAFLVLNFPPAKGFLGNAGTLFLGGFLAMLSFFPRKPDGVYNLYPVFVIFAIPIMDVAWAIVRRTKKKLSPFYPDQEHIHHKLLNVGLKPRQVCFFLWSITTLLGLLAVKTRFLPPTGKGIVFILLFVVWLVIAILLRWIG